MEPKYSKPPLPNPIPLKPYSHVNEFKFSTIGQGPSLLQRMSDGPGVPNRPPQPDPHPSQEQDNTLHARVGLTLPQPLITDPSSVDPGQSVKSIPTQRGISLAPISTSLPPFDPQNDVKPAQPPDQIRASVFPDLQYPNTPDVESPVSWESNIVFPQPAPMDQDAPPSHLPDTRNLPPVPVADGIASAVDGAPESSADSFPSALLQTGDATNSVEPEQVRRPVEHLLKLASVRQESMTKRRETFDHRSGELSNFCAEAMRAVQDLQDKIESFKQLGEETRAQAEQTIQEANKVREMADRLISSVGTLSEDMVGTKIQVGRAVERSEQITRFVRKSFDWLAMLRAREQEKVAAIQAEIAEQELAEVARRQQELERRKIEEQQKKEAAQREEAEREALRKKMEEEAEAERKRSYAIRRAEVMANKWRPTQADAQSIQAERERGVTDASGSNALLSARDSLPPGAIIPPAPNSHSAGISTSVAPSQVAIPAPSRSPVARTGGVQEFVPTSHPLPPSNTNKVKTVPLVSFVPAQTDAGRAVNTDSPLSSTTLASEHMRNNVEASQHPLLNHPTRDPAQEQIQPQMLRQAATPPSHQVEVKREPSAEALPAVPVKSSPDNANTGQSHDHQPVVSLSTASHNGNMDQQFPIFESQATSLHVAETEDRSPHSDPSGTSSQSSQDDRPRDFIHHHVDVVPDRRAHRRQDSVSSDRSLPRWNYCDRSSSPPSSRERRSRSPSRSPPYLRKRPRSPYLYETRPDYWSPERPYVRARQEDDRDRFRRYNGYDRGRRGDSPNRYRHPPSRRNVYRRSPSPPPPPPLPRQFRNGSPPRRNYRERTPVAQHVPLRGAEWRPVEYWPGTNTRHYESTYEGADSRRIVEMEEQPRLQQHERQRHSPSPSEHDRMPTFSHGQEEVEIGLLDRIHMEADDRGRGRGRPPPGIVRGAPNSRRGMRGASSNSLRRSGGPGLKPALLSRMTETATRLAPAAPAPSLSDRMQQD